VAAIRERHCESDDKRDTFLQKFNEKFSSTTVHIIKIPPFGDEWEIKMNLKMVRENKEDEDRSL
jgi:hypothetical protein